MKTIFTGLRFTSSLLMALTLMVSSCKRIDDNRRPDAPEVTYIALVNGNQLVEYHAQQAGMGGQPLSVTGIGNGESILSIDFRPATGQLYAVTNGSRLYIINLDSGVATAIGEEPFSPAIDGNVVSIDFNPTVDRIRLVTSSGQNLRLNPETGTVAATDGSINGVSNAAIGGVAYTENFAGATSTTLYDIDVATNKLYRQDPPNDGTLVEVGGLGVDVSEVHGFDIAVQNNSALAVLRVNGQAALYNINLSTGAATMVSEPLNAAIGSIAIYTRPVAYAVCQDGKLLIFDPNNIDIISKEISGLAAGEHLVGIDFRPLNGQLYALGSASNLYTVNASSGALTKVGTGKLSTRLSGTAFGFDFNPTVDRIRVVSNTGQNLRLHPVTGEVAAVDGNLNPGDPSVIAAGYTNSVPEAFANANATTELFVVDAATSALFIQNPPNDGVLVSVGSLGISIEGTAGFDVSARNNRGYGIFSTAGQNGLFTVDLASGSTSVMGNFPTAVTGFALGLGF